MNTSGKMKTLAAAVAVGAMFVASQASAATASAVLRLTFGESQFLAYSWGASQSGTVGGGGGGGVGRVNVQDVSVTRLTDAQSPQIFRAVALGQVLPFVELETGGIKFRLENVLISSYSTGGAINNKDKTPPTDNVTFTFGKIIYTVDGTSTCFDITLNRSC